MTVCDVPLQIVALREGQFADAAFVLLLLGVNGHVPLQRPFHVEALQCAVLVRFSLRPTHFDTEAQITPSKSHVVVTDLAADFALVRVFVGVSRLHVAHQLQRRLARLAAPATRQRCYNVLPPKRCWPKQR